MKVRILVEFNDIKVEDTSYMHDIDGTPFDQAMIKTSQAQEALVDAVRDAIGSPGFEGWCESVTPAISTSDLVWSDESVTVSLVNPVSPEEDDWLPVERGQHDDSDDDNSEEAGDTQHS